MIMIRPSTRRILTTFAVALLTAACGELAHGPALTKGTPLALAIALPGEGVASSIFSADVDAVRVQVRRQNESTAVDTIMRWAASDQEFRIAVDVPLVQRFETLYVYVDLMAGQATRFYGSHQVVLRAEVVPAIPPFELFYVGPGSDATFISVNPRAVVLQPVGTVQMSANVRNGQGLVVTPPVAFSVSDTRLATISATGLLTAKAIVGPVWVRAATPTGLRDSVQVQISTASPLPQVALRAPE